MKSSRFPWLLNETVSAVTGWVCVPMTTIWVFCSRGDVKLIQVLWFPNGPEWERERESVGRKINLERWEKERRHRVREGSDKDRWIKKNWFWEVGVGGMRGSDGRVKQEERKVDAQDYWHGWGIKTDCFSGFQDQWIEQPCSNLKFISKFYCSFIHPSIHACIHPFMHPSVFLSLFAVLLLVIEFFQRVLQRAGLDFFFNNFFGLFVLVEQACSNMLFIANFPYNPHSWAQILSNLIWSNAPSFF